MLQVCTFVLYLLLAWLSWQSFGAVTKAGKVYVEHSKDKDEHVVFVGILVIIVALSLMCLSFYWLFKAGALIGF